MKVVKSLDIVNDYIEKLEQENKHLNLQLDQALKDYEELLVKIDKAKEYIKDNFTNLDGNIWHEDMKIIYNILGGDSDGM